MTYFDPSQIFGKFTDKEIKEAGRDDPPEKRQIQLRETGEAILTPDCIRCIIKCSNRKVRNSVFFMILLFFFLSTFIQHSKLNCYCGHQTPKSEGT